MSLIQLVEGLKNKHWDFPEKKTFNLQYQFSAWVSKILAYNTIQILVFPATMKLHEPISYKKIFLSLSLCMLGFSRETDYKNRYTATNSGVPMTTHRFTTSHKQPTQEHTILVIKVSLLWEKVSHGKRYIGQSSGGVQMWHFWLSFPHGVIGSITSFWLWCEKISRVWPARESH